MQEKTQYCDAKRNITGFYSSKVKTNNNKYEGTEEHRFGTMCCRPFSVFEPGTYVSGNTSWLQGNPLTQESYVIQTAITPLGTKRYFRYSFRMCKIHNLATSMEKDAHYAHLNRLNMLMEVSS